MGDFNIDILKYGSNDYANRFLNQMYSSQFYPVINRPTRITTNSATIIGPLQDPGTWYGINYTGT